MLDGIRYWIKYSNLDIIEATDGPRPVVMIDLLGLESFLFVRAELVVQDRIHVDDDIVLLGSFGQFEEFFLGSILCTNPGLLVKLAEVIDVVNVIADTLQSNNRLVTSRTEKFRGAPLYQRPLSALG
jgi:hypothetical protein